MNVVEILQKCLDRGDLVFCDSELKEPVGCVEIENYDTEHPEVFQVIFKDSPNSKCRYIMYGHDPNWDHGYYDSLRSLKQRFGEIVVIPKGSYRKLSRIMTENKQGVLS